MSIQGAHYEILVSYDSNMTHFLLVGGRHNIESGVWNREILGYYNGTGHTIRSAIDLWYNHSEESLVFRDVCSGPHCSNACPEQIALSENEENNWSLGVKIVIAAVVLLIGVTCLVMKVSLLLCRYKVSSK